MKELFADTHYFLALANPADVDHDQALEAFPAGSARMVTTTWILAEVGNALAKRANRHRFLELVKMLKEDSDAVIVPATERLFARGLELFRRHPDKDWSITDCISFTIMRDRKIHEALTADRHFAQAGFLPLL